MIIDKSLTNTSSKLLTPEQAAELLQVSKRTIYDWLRSGEIPSERIGDRLIRIRESDVLSPDVRIFFEQGCRLAQHPDTVNRAEEFFRKAIALNPRYGLAYFELGRMFFAWSHFRRAIEPMRKAIELNPSFPAYMNFGMNCNRGGMHEEAEKALRKALEFQPNNVVAHHELGYCLMITSFHDKERMGEAVAHFRQSLAREAKASEKSGSYELSALFLGEALVLHLQDFSGATSFVEEIEETFPNTAKHIRFLVELNTRR